MVNITIKSFPMNHFVVATKVQLQRKMSTGQERKRTYFKLKHCINVRDCRNAWCCLLLDDLRSSSVMD